MLFASTQLFHHLYFALLLRFHLKHHSAHSPTFQDPVSSYHQYSHSFRYSFHFTHSLSSMFHRCQILHFFDCYRPTCLMRVTCSLRVTCLMKITCFPEVWSSATIVIQILISLSISSIWTHNRHHRHH